jgi:hypothetical protein
VFAINIDGSRFTNLHSFGPGDAAISFNLTLSGGALYGTAENGVAVINTDGSGLRTVYQFNAIDARLLTSSNDSLYGISDPGGINPTDPDPLLGAVWKLRSDGTGFTNLHLFFSGSAIVDGGSAAAGLLLVGDTLYGTAQCCDFSGNPNGTVFKVNTDGSGFATVHRFTPTDHPRPVWLSSGLLFMGQRRTPVRCCSN